MGKRYLVKEVEVLTMKLYTLWIIFQILDHYFTK